jgi:hypothetical protein
MFNYFIEKLRDRLNSVDRKIPIVIAAVSTGVIAIAAGGAYYSPYHTLNNLKNATENRNPDALSQEINFPELRVSIKENVKAQILEQMTKNGTSTLPKTTNDTVDRMVIPMVDKLVTPEGIERLMLDRVPEAKIDLSNLDRDIAKSQITMGYESLDRFVVHITDKVDRSKDVSLILKRDGLAWKLAGINISKV